MAGMMHQTPTFRGVLSALGLCGRPTPGLSVSNPRRVFFVPGVGLP